jgi:hypothetical protein
MTISQGLSKYQLHLVGIQEARWEDGGKVPAGEHTFSYENRIENHQLGRGFFCA